MRDAVLVLHIAFGVVGLVLGPLALAASRAPARAADGYKVAVAGVAATAVVLAVTAWDEYWWLIGVAAATEGALLFGLRAWQRRGPGWTTACAHLLGGSYVALVTGALIAFTGVVVFWLLPAVLAQWPIAVAKRRLVEQAELPRGDSWPVHSARGIG